MSIDAPAIARPQDGAAQFRTAFAGPPAGDGARSSDATAAAAGCRHCGTPVPAGAAFCCSGCDAAYAVISGLGLEAYYRRRAIDPEQRPLRPDPDEADLDLDAYVREETGEEGEQLARLDLLVEGLHCAACVWLIEAVLARQPGIVRARLNMTTRRLHLVWRRAETSAAELVAAITRLGYRLVPYDPRCIAASDDAEQKALLRAVAVAGFAAGNIMLLSVSVWAGHAEGMGPATRTFLHWLSALIALPAIAYAGRPFFRAAVGALAARRVTMDVPISVGVVLAAAMSLYETAVGGPHAYFDAAVGLLFFLLIGRYLDRLTRGRARSAAERLLALAERAVTVLDAGGARRLLPPAQVRPGMHVLVAAGERIAVDGRVLGGESTIDTSLIDGESLPKPVAPGATVLAGALNQAAPLTLQVDAAGSDTVLAGIARQVEIAEAQRGRYVALADRVARLYAPLVHSAALVTFLAWWLLIGATWQAALLNAIAVLIITCPCALGLAVPAVQAIASGRLLRRGILLRSPTALERLADVDMVVFDKTGTLTEGQPVLVDRGGADAGELARAAGLAAASRHPLARALVRAAEAETGALAVATDAREVPGQGLQARNGARLGSRGFCDITRTDGDTLLELWFAEPDRPPRRFAFADQPRADAAVVTARLAARGYPLHILSGDRPQAVAAVAHAVGIADWQAGLRPGQKLAALQAQAAAGRRPLMVGDGLNDAPALAAAHASMSPSTAIDATQTAADLVFQGTKLAPVAEALAVARHARALIRQNIALSFGYNALAVPLAMAGLVTPLIAAIVMSTSSILVVLNALRLNRLRGG